MLDSPRQAQDSVVTKYAQRLASGMGEVYRASDEQLNREVGWSGFLVSTVAEEGIYTPIDVVLNWTAGLKK